MNDYNFYRLFPAGIFMVKSGSKANAKRKYVEELQESDDRFPDIG